MQNSDGATSYLRMSNRTLGSFASGRDALRSSSGSAEGSSTRPISVETGAAVSRTSSSSSLRRSQEIVHAKELARASRPPPYEHCPPPPSLRASLLSRLFFWWPVDILIRAKRQGNLTLQDLWKLRDEDATQFLSSTFHKYWEEEKTKKNSSLAFALSRLLGWRYFWSGVPLFVSGICNLCVPLFLESFLSGRESSNSDASHFSAYLLTATLFFLLIAEAVTNNLYYYGAGLVEMNIIQTLSCAIYGKSLSLNNKSRQDTPAGDIINLISSDVEKVAGLVWFGHQTWSAPLSIVISLLLLYNVMGWSALAGVFAITLLIPVNSRYNHKMDKMTDEKQKCADKRISIVTELLQGMRVVKLFAWENRFVESIGSVRSEEHNKLTLMRFYTAILDCAWSASPVLLLLVTFATYVLAGNTLTATKAFFTMSVVSNMTWPLYSFPTAVNRIKQAKTSISRLQEYLLLPEVSGGEQQETKEEDKGIREEKEIRENFAVAMREASFKWDKSSQDIILRDINLHIKVGELVMVIGRVGSGKSSLISAILGDMEKESGKVSVFGRIAYVSQQAWIQNDTIKENILLGHVCEEARYSSVLDVCELEADLSLFEDRDNTMVGERGLNLSGGQKQRISLARAVYSDRDVYLLDDPLSAVDPHVASSLMSKCVTGMLRNKTRILVTHQLQFLDRADRIIVMEEGRIVASGTLEQLRALYARSQLENNNTKDDLSFLFLLDPSHKREEQVVKKEEEHKGKEHVTPSLPRSVLRKSSGRFSSDTGKEDAITKDEEKKKKEEEIKKEEGEEEEEEEEEEVSESPLRLLKEYVRAAKNSKMIILLLIVMIAQQSARIIPDYWLSVWSEQGFSEQEGEKAEHTNLPYLYSYVIFAVLKTCMSFVFYMVFTHVTLQIASNIHAQLLRKVLRAPISFFNNTPMGRIVSRFSTHQDSIEESVPWYLKELYEALFLVLTTCGMVALSVSLAFTGLLIPAVTAYIYWLVFHYYRIGSIEIEKLSSRTKNPFISHLSESINGASTIRAYRCSSSFLITAERLMYQHSQAKYADYACWSWQTVTLKLMGAGAIISACLFIAGKQSISAGTAGLLLTYLFEMPYMLGSVVMNASSFLSSLPSLQRMLDYNKLEEEKYEAPEGTPALPPSWPSSSSIQFKNVCMRYSAGLPLVLNDVSMSVPSGTRVGICGRTGAGKSSLLVALFRLCELESGSILIDRTDISSISLTRLRNSLSIIPQDPVLFTGCIRDNLDPFQSYSDSEIWQALDRTSMRETVEKLPEKLSAEIVSGGDNFSVGQRQLLCLARAILKKRTLNTFILVMDEATASVDMDTDAFIQRVIREEFSGCTVLTIAHRLDTIADSDMIIVMDKGKIEEMGTPQELIRKEDKTQECAQLFFPPYDESTSFRDAVSLTVGERVGHIFVFQSRSVAHCVGTGLG